MQRRRGLQNTSGARKTRSAQKQNRVIADVVRRASASTVEPLENRWLLSSIGINFTGGYQNPGGNPPVTVPPTSIDNSKHETAGSYDPGYNQVNGVNQANWNNLNGGTGTAGTLVDDANAVSGASVSWDSGGTWASATNQPADGNEELNTGFLNSSGTTKPVSITVSNIPYAQYDVYVFTLNDGVRTQTTTSNGVTYYGQSPDPHTPVTTPNAPGTEAFIDSNANTPYAYIPITSRNIANPSVNGDIVYFHLQGGTTWTMQAVSPGNGYVNGIQIVDRSTGALAADLPETPVLAGTNFTDSVALKWGSAAAGSVAGGPVNQGILGGYSYNIYRGTSAGTETLFTTISAAPGTTAFSDTTATPVGNTFFYKVSAVSPTGHESVLSNEVQGKIDLSAPPDVPTNFAASTDATVPAITLTWTPPSSTTTTYQIFRSSTGPGGTFTSIATIDNVANPGVSSYTDSFAPGSAGSFLYKIQAFNGTNTKGQSDFVGGGFGTNVAQGFTGTGDGLSGYYYNNITDGTKRAPWLGNTPVYSRIDPTINITNGGSNTPPPGAPLSWNSVNGAGSNFTSAWTGFVQPRFNETYTFFPGSDDGIELQVKNLNTGQFVLIDDNYTAARGVTEDPRTMPFKFIAGQKYEIRMLFRQQGGGWGWELSWQSNSQTKEIVPTAQLYAVAPLPVTLAAVSNDKVVVLNWPGMAGDDVVVYRGTSAATLAPIATLGGSANTYTDTGVNNGTQYFYKVTGEVRNAGGGAVFGSTDTNTVSVTPIGPANVAAPSLTSTRTDWNKVQLNWNQVPFAQQYHVFRSTNSNMSNATELTTVTYSNTLAPFQGLSYTDSTVSMGTTYFYTVQSQFGTATGTSGTFLADLQHGVEAHYYNEQFWHSNTQNDTGNGPSPLGPEITGVPLGNDNFNGQTFGGVSTSLNGNGLPAWGARQADQLGFLPSLDKDYNSGSPIGGIGATSWSAVYTGKIHNNTSATFTFVANADDDMWVYVDGLYAVSDPNGHGTRDIAGVGVNGSPISLAAGDHSVVVFYSQGTGGDVARLRYSMNGGATTTISTFNTTTNLYWNSFISDKPAQVDNAPIFLTNPALGLDSVVGREGESPTIQLGFTNSLTSNPGGGPGNSQNSAVSFIVERSDVTGGAFTNEWLPVTNAGLGYDPMATSTPKYGLYSHVSTFDATALPGHSYQYRVRAANFDGIGDPSPASAIISIPVASTNIFTQSPGSNTGGAEAHYYNDQFWGSPLSRGQSSNSKNAITQWGLGGYLDGQATNRRIEASYINQNGNNSPYVGQVDTFTQIHNVNFSVAYTGKIHITSTGTYSFMTNTDDDGYLWVSNGTQQVLVSQDGGGHGTRNASDSSSNITPIVLTAGNNYDFLFAMSQGGGGWGQNLFWRPAGAPFGQPFTLVPPAQDSDPTSTFAGMLSMSNPVQAPTSLTVGTPNAQNRVALTWTDNNSSEIRYVIERATDAAFTQNVTMTQSGMNSSSFTDIPQQGNTYFYRIRAENFDFVSGWTAGSTSAVLANKLPLPINLSATQVGSEIHVAWSNQNSPGGSEVGTVIQRSVDGGTFANYFTTQRQFSTFTDQAVVPGHSYAYQIASAQTVAFRPVLSGSDANAGTQTPTYSISATTLGASDFTAPVSVNYVDASGNVDRTAGFKSSDAGTLLNLVNGPTITSDGRLRMLDGGGGENRAAWLKAGSGFLGGQNSYGGQWDSEFDYSFSSGQNADGFTFMLQRNSPNAVGGGGGALGWQGANNGGTNNSIGIYFNLWQNLSETGLMLNGNRTQTVGLQNVPSFGNKFHSADVFHVSLAYDGKGNLNYTLTDKTNPATFTTSYPVDPTQVMLDQNTIVGFTGGTGGATTTLDVLNWWFSPSGQSAPTTITGTNNADYIYLKASAPGSSTINYWTSGTPFTSAPTSAPTGTYNNTTSSGVKIHGLGGSDAVTVDETNGPVFVANTKYNVNVVGTSGTYQIAVTTLGGTQTTGAIAYNASAATVQAAIAGLSNVGAGKVTVTQAAAGVSGNAGSPYLLTFDPTVAAGITNITTTNITGGTTATVTIAGGSANSQLDSVTGAAVAGSVTVNVIGTSAAENFSSDAANAKFLFTTGTTKADSLSMANVGQITYTDGGGAGDNITVSGATPVTVNASANDNITVNTGSTAIVNATGGSDTLTVSSGASANVNTTGNATINASNAGTLGLTAGTGNPTFIVNGAGSTNVTLASGNATVTLNGTGTQSITPGSGSTALTINGGTATIAANPGTGIRKVNFSSINIGASSKLVAASTSSDLVALSSHANRSVLSTNGLTIQGTGATLGTLDLTDNDLIVLGGGAQQDSYRQLIRTAFAGASWSGKGLTSAAAQADPNKSLGYSKAVDTANGINKPTFDGVSGLTANDLIVKFTWSGDANLDGAVTTADYAFIDGNLPTPSGSQWNMGDFNFDGATTTSDYAFIDGTVGSSGL